MDASIEIKPNSSSKKMVMILLVVFGVLLIFCCVAGVVIQRAISSRAEIYGKCYEVRDNKVYFKYRVYEKSPEEFNPEGKELEVDADAASFEEIYSDNCWTTKDSVVPLEELGWRAIGKDKDNVYSGPRVSPGVSPDGFVALENKSYYNMPQYYANNESVYYFNSKGELVELELDRENVEVQEGTLVTDGVNTYDDGKLVK